MIWGLAFKATVAKRGKVSARKVHPIIMNSLGISCVMGFGVGRGSKRAGSQCGPQDRRITLCTAAWCHWWLLQRPAPHAPAATYTTAMCLSCDTTAAGSCMLRKLTGGAKAAHAATAASMPVHDVQNIDATFDKVKVLYEGEKYVDTSRYALPPVQASPYILCANAHQSLHQRCSASPLQGTRAAAARAYATAGRNKERLL